MATLHTARLELRQLTFEDAPFILELLNEPGWLRFIGDKGVRNLDDAVNYIRQGPMASYERFGFGLYVASLRDSPTPIGMCGLIKRDTLPDVDIGFAFLERYQGNGYAHEAAARMLEHARNDVGLAQVVAITTIDNEGSANVLRKVGMRFDSMVKLSPADPELRLFVLV